MQLIAPDILTEARGLTGAMLGTITVLGVCLWLFGWRWHRFWVVLGITFGAGLIGLNAGRTGGTQVMAVGILLAVGAGMMAMELAKVIAFIAGGIGAWLTVQWVLPSAQELWAVFLSGGLFGLLLYRLWTMLLTSLMGTLLAGHAGLLLLAGVMNFDAIEWATTNMVALNGLAVGLTVLGILVQAAAAREQDVKEAKVEKDEAKVEETHEEPEHEIEVVEAIPVKEEKKDHNHEKRAPWWKKLFTFNKAA
jgi:hypothetical protein